MVAARVGIPALLRRPEPRAGRFVAVASAAATRGLPGLAAYCAAKAGVGGFVRALGADLRGTGVTANAIAPGSTDTPILAERARLYGLDSAADFAAQQPLERLLEPAELAAMIALAARPRGRGGDRRAAARRRRPRDLTVAAPKCPPGCRTAPAPAPIVCVPTIRKALK